jgi:hypothetical protein
MLENAVKMGKKTAPLTRIEHLFWASGMPICKGLVSSAMGFGSS